MSADAAVSALLTSPARCLDAVLTPPPDSFVSRSAARAELRRFKLDVSFALTAARTARFSANDKGEPHAFRTRALEPLRTCGMHEAAKRFFSLSEPGAVQTTLGIKWGVHGRADRMSLYFEELTRDVNGPSLMSRVPAAFDVALPPMSGGTPAAICADFETQSIPFLVGIKDYWMFEEREERAAATLPPALETFRREFPLDPMRGTRRYLFARRFSATGQLIGHKLLWQSEAHDPTAATRAWAHVDRLTAIHAPAPSRTRQALDELRQTWPSSDHYVYPDLVCLNVDADGERPVLVIYVSAK